MTSPPLNKPTNAASLCELGRDQLDGWCIGHGFPRYRADQIRRWMFSGRAAGIEHMHDLPRDLRAALEAEFPLFTSEVTQHRIARDRTEKLLLKLHDGEFVECVLMRETKRRTICISTQVGCAMGCVFCASGMQGLKRNLTVGEILQQVLRLDRLLGADERITNVVVMGIGEPLANLPNLVPILELMTDRYGLELSPRRITVSTVGLPEKIRQFAALGKPYNLAVSLHAPNDELRTRIVPTNKNIGIAAILAATDEYFERTGRRVTFEYVLLSGVNDGPNEARQLARLMAPRNAHVNLIPMNGVSGLPYVSPSPPRTRQFVDLLEESGVPATVRKRKGADIDAACGQLRLQQLETGV